MLRTIKFELLMAFQIIMRLFRILKILTLLLFLFTEHVFKNRLHFIKPILNYYKIKINDEKEREEFKEYVEKASITEDDSYGILKNIIKQVPKSYILEREEYKGIKENLYESFVMKKYLGSTKLDIRNKIREKTREIDEITNIKGKMKILREIEEKIKTKEFMSPLWDRVNTLAFRQTL